VSAKDLEAGGPASGAVSGAADSTAGGQNEAEVQQILEKVDREAKHRFLIGWQSLLVSVIAIAFSCFHIYTAFFGVLDAHLQRAVHLGFVLTLLYLLYPFTGGQRRDRFGLTDLIPVLLSLGALGYLVFYYPQLVLRAGLLTTMDVVVGTIGILLVFEAGRRIIGWPMVIIAAVFVFYGFFGEIMPDLLAHRNLKVSQLVNHLWFTTEGVFGIPLGVSSTFVFMFLLFAAFVETTGIGKLFIDLGNAVAGWATGGPAKVAVITSALEGTVEGSSVSNVVGSGSFTIPMMKKLGYSGAFAGAVEAAASTGGQLMPPIMGAAAFLMAEFLNIPYLEVAKAAAIPAVLYFAGIFAGVHLEAKKLGLRGMPRSQLVRFKTIILEEGHLLIPLVGIVYLLVRGYSLMRVALLATGLTVVASLIRKSTRITIPKFIHALDRGARSALGVGTACALAGVIVGVVTKTGAGLKLASGILSISQNNIYLTMFFTMLTSIILGMGVPTTANYIITSTIAAPALLTLGVVPIAAHLFVFYFGIIADLTPPVALAAYAGAAIARANPMKTGVIATRLAVGAFILPYIFVLNPQMLLVHATFFGVIFAVFTAMLGMVCLSAALTGYLLDNLHWGFRVVLLAAGLMLLDPGVLTDGIGLAVVVGIGTIQVILKRRRALAG
jgi:TRAP transporter 4TM/12TM fusion protein